MVHINVYVQSNCLYGTSVPGPNNQDPHLSARILNKQRYNTLDPDTT